ncbi:hypothetical protein Bca52824_020990 [Brassica carinata]|uniref:RNA-dependent RNA polymerase n=1 Tax=Brassica carinata TaxID=52824 RepID=A0A8X7VTL0_BRACI|nr:hypothetical protein Bca52824_020990 [Brassica carinata]
MPHYIREVKLVELRTKTRILIPKGRSMMGCMDETNTLEYGEVFVRCSYESLNTKSQSRVRIKSHNKSYSHARFQVAKRDL